MDLAMKSKSRRSDPFGAESPTQPSGILPLQKSGRHSSYRDPIIEEVVPPTRERRRHSSDRETIRKPTTWDVEEEAAATPRPRVAFTHVPRVIMHETEIVNLPLRAQTGFILGHIDGKTNVQTLVDIAGMAAEDVLRVLDELLLFGVISVK